MVCKTQHEVPVELYPRVINYALIGGYLGSAQKECDETIYWFELLKETEYLKETEFESINKEAVELLKMLRSAIITSKKITHNL